MTTTIAGIARFVTERPSAPALTCEDRTLTYGRLGGAVATLGRTLTKNGVRPGDHVVVVAHRSERFVIAQLAVLAVGAVFVPVERRQPADRVTQVVANGQARCVIDCDGGLAVAGTPVVPFDAEALAAAVSAAGSSAVLDVSDVGSSAPVYCIYTSGSSGAPKGVVVEDGGLGNLVAGFLDPLLAELGAERVALLAPFAFDASIKMIFGALATGRHLLVLTDDERDDIDRLAARLTAHDTDVLDCTPSYLRALRRAWEPASRSGTVPRLRGLLVGGEALDPATADWAAATLGATVWNVYGPTEATVDATAHRHVPGSGTVTIGRPIPGVDVRIVRGGRPVGPGLPGELWIGGAGVARGYLGDPELTAERFVTDPFGEGSGRYYRTGDLARRLPDGSFAYLRRIDDQIKVRGFRVEPGEVEHAMTRIDGITGAAAVVVDDDGRGQSLIGYYTADGSLDESETVRELARTLPEHLVPAMLVAVDTLPLTANGKLDRAALRSRGLPDRDQGSGVVPEGPEETAVAEAFAHVLRCAAPAADTDFFALGGDSISAILIVAALARSGYHVRAREILTLRTPAAIAAVLTALEAPVERLPADGAVEPVPIIADFLDRGYPDPQHHHQSIEVPLAAGQARHVPGAVAELVRRHAVLAAHVSDGTLVVPPPPQAGQVPIEDWDLTGHADAELRDALERHATALSARTDLSTGPLLAAAVVRTAGRTALYLTAHHLAVDAVSWRIVADDLAGLLAAATAGTEPPPAVRTASFREWASRLRSFGRSATAQQDRPHWTRTLEAARDLSDRLRPLADVPQEACPPVRHRIALGTHATRALLAQDTAGSVATDGRIEANHVVDRNVVDQDSHGAPHEILLAALSRAARAVWGIDRVPLLIESHGRPEDVPGLDDVDVSATVGWFTAVYPVAIDADGDPAATLRATRAALRAVPHEGITAGLLFPVESTGAGLGVVNYLGETAGGGLNPYGTMSADGNLDSRALSVDAVVTGGELVVDLRVRADLADARDDAAFAAELRAALEEYAAAEPNRVLTAVVPADVGLSSLSVAEFDTVRTVVTGGIEEGHPLTPLQEGMLFEHLAGGTDHVVQIEYSHGAPFDPDRLERTVTQLVQVTPALRSRFVWEGLAVPHQIVLAEPDFSFDFHDLRGRSAHEAETIVAERSARRHAQPFDLVGEGPLRCDVFATDDEPVRIVLTHHHVILDGWSLSELLRRFAEIYAALGRGGSGLPAGDVALAAPTFAEYAAWSAGQDTTRAERYWADLLDGYETEVAFPRPDDDVGGPGSAGASGTERVDVVGEPGLAARLTARFAGTGATLAHLTQAALGLVLGRACGSDDVVLGNVDSGRDVPLPGIEHTVGLFIDTVPVRVTARTGTTVADLVASVRDQALAGADHHRVSLARIGSLAGRDDLVRCLFAFENYHVSEAGPAEGRLEFRGAREQTNYPLTVTAEQRGDDLAFSALVDVAEFARQDAERIVERVGHVLERFAADPDAPVTDVPTITRAESRVVTEDFNRTGTRYERDGSLGAVFARTAARFADRVAVTGGGAEVSYGDLAGRARAVAGVLRSAGVRGGQLVGVVGAPGVGLITAVLGIVQADAGYVPMDPDAPADRGRFVVTDADLRVVVVVGRAARTTVEEWGTDVLVVDVTEVAPPNDADRAGTELVRADGADGADTDRAGTGRPGAGSAGQDPAYVLYTSGTTGVPKGVVVPHRAVLRLVQGSRSLPIGPDDVLVQTGAVTFDASTFEIWGPLLNGGTLVTAGKEDILELDGFRRLIRDHRVTVLWLTVSLFNEIVGTEPHVLDGVERVVIGGEQVSPHHVARLYAVNPDIEVINGYGPTENTTFTTTHRIDRHQAADRPVPIGRPISNTRVHILSRHGQVCGIGEIGELCAAGDGLATGYLDRPDLTADRFTAHPVTGERLYRTGDLARWRSGGVIDFLGRVDDQQLKVRGFRIEVGEVETAIRDTSLVRDAIVTGHRTDPTGPLALVAYVVPLREGDDAGAQLATAIRDRLTERLPGYMIPGSFTPIDRIPLTRNGKLDRAALPVPAPAPVGPDDSTGPENGAEEAVCSAFAQVLGLDGVGVLDNFFEAGGDSISAIRVVSAVRQAGYDVTVSHVMAQMTPRGIARGLEPLARRRGTGQGAVAGPVPGIGMIEEFFGWDLAAPEHFNQDLLLDVGRATPAQVREALDAVWAHHDALRATVVDGTLSIRPPDGARYGFEHVRLDGDGDGDDGLADAASRAQTGMRFGPDGILFRAVLATRPDSTSMVLLVAHHLVVDIVSWQIIVEDVRTALRAAAGDGSHPAAGLPARTGSIIDWGTALQHLADRIPATTRAYWDRVDAESRHALIPRGYGDPARAGAGAAPVVSELHLDRDTSAEVARAAEMYHATVEDVLLTAVTAGIGGTTGLDRVAVRLERHGRYEHDLLPRVDRTVGWFTSMYPVVLPTAGEPATGEPLITVKEILRQVPDGGRDYALLPGGLSRMMASVTFNYLGTTNRAADHELVPEAGDETITGVPSHPDNRFHHGIRVNARTEGGRIRIHLAADPWVLAEPHVTALVAGVRSALAQLAGHGRGLDRPRKTSSDHSVAFRLDPADQALLERRYDPVDIGEPTPLQEGMLFHALEDPAGSAHVVQQVFRLPEPVSSETLRAAVDALTRRHPVLRTAFATEGLLRPRQVVLADRPLPVTELDLGGSSHDAAATRDAHLASAVSRGFDLADDPLLRITHLRAVDASGTERHELAWTYHHIVLDGWSLSLLFGDLLRYLGQAREQDSGRLLELAGRELAETEVAGRSPFVRYARQLREHDAAAADDHWARTLEGYDTTARFAAMSGTGAEPAADAVVRVNRISTTGLAERLTARYAGTGITLAHAAQAAFAMVLARACGSDDVVFGNVVSGRDVPLAGIEDTVGLFINTLPLRVTTGPGDTVVDVLTHVRDRALAAADHGGTPLARIQRHTGQDDLVHALFAFENFRTHDAVFDDDDGLRFLGGREQTTYPVTLAAQHTGRDIELTALVDAVAHTRADAELIVGRVLHVLEQIADSPDELLSGLATLGPEDLDLVTHGFNRTEVDYDRRATAVTLFLDGVRAHPERPALLWRDDVLTYADVARDAARVARALAQAGVPRGALVGLVGERSSALVIGMLGSMFAGTAYVPLDVASPVSRLEKIGSDARPAAYLTVGPRGVAHATALAALVPGTAVIDLDDVLSASGAEPWHEGAVDRARLPRPEDLAYCIYTSGTTGTPKGVQLTHQGVANLRAHLNGYYDVRPDDRVLQFANITFDASVWEVVLALLTGAGLVVVDQDVVHDVALLTAEAERTGVTLALLPPQYWLEADALRLRVLTTGGAASSAAVVAKARRASIRYVNAYGPSETTVLATGWADDGRALGSGPVPIGGPVANTQVYVIAGDRVCGIGETGELCVAGDGVGAGYVGLPDLTAERFVTDPVRGGRMYRTGDLARWRADGTVDFLGRVDDQQLKVRGFRIEVGEVEAAVRESGLVRDVVVVGHRSGPEAAMALAAYVVPADSGGLDGEDRTGTDLAAGLRGELAERLPGYMVPSSFTVVDRIPLTRNGKLDRAALPAPVSGPSAAGERVLPANPAEEAVCLAFEQVLDTGPVGVLDNFFEAGGDSISAIRVVGVLRQAGYDSTVSHVMAGMTPRGIARRLSRAAGRDDVDQGVVTGPVTGIPVIEDFFTWPLAVPEHFNQDVLLDVGEVTAGQVRAALDAVWAHHDVLRAAVVDGTLTIRPPDQGTYGFEHVHPEGDDVGGRFARAASRAQEGMRFGVDGALLRAVLETRADGTSRLFLAAHHLVVDVVSWQVITDDIRTALTTAGPGGGAGLPAKTASIVEWGRALRRLADQVPAESRAHWERVDAEVGRALIPRELGDRRPDEAQSTIELAVDEETSAGVARAAEMYHATVEDVLLTAVTAGIGGTTGLDRVAVRLERHGRYEHDLLPRVDRTVGWFTSMYPVVVPAGRTDPGEALIEVKEALRAVPDGGRDYGLLPGGLARLKASVTFNYLGVTRDADPGAQVLQTTPSHPDNRLHAGVRVNARSHAGRLHVQLTVDHEVLSERRARDLADRIRRSLAELSSHGQALSQPRRTAGDLAATDLDAEELDELNALFGG